MINDKNEEIMYDFEVSTVPADWGTRGCSDVAYVTVVLYVVSSTQDGSVFHILISSSRGVPGPV